MWNHVDLGGGGGGSGPCKCYSPQGNEPQKGRKETWFHYDLFGQVQTSRV